MSNIKPQSEKIKCSLRPEQWELSRLRKKECSSNRKHTGKQETCRACGDQTTTSSVRSLLPSCLRQALSVARAACGWLAGL